MTEKKKAMVVQSPTALVVNSREEWDMLREQATVLVASGILPDAIKTPEAAAVIMIKGRDLGLPPMEAFEHLHVINGTVGYSALYMRRRFFEKKPDALWEIVEQNEMVCTIRTARKKGDKVQEFSYTMEDAQRAGLTNPTKNGKPSMYTKHPTEMLFARCTTNAIRAVHPEVMGSVSYSTEELQGIVDTENVTDVQIEEVETLPDPDPVDAPSPEQESQVSETYGDTEADPIASESQAMFFHNRLDDLANNAQLGGKTQLRYLNDMIERVKQVHLHMIPLDFNKLATRIDSELTRVRSEAEGVKNAN